MATTTTTPTLSDARQLDERELRAWRGMLRAHAALTKALDADLDSAHGLPLSSYEVLLYLNDAEDRRMRMRDLAASVILSRSGLTRLADRLEREGLIRRESCSSDARGAFAVLTPVGAEMLAAARTTHLAGVRSLFLQHFSGDELDVLGDAWDRVVPGSASAPGPTCG
jgi:DNA-binding MarR family transcriptional regulator